MSGKVALACLALGLAVSSYGEARRIGFPSDVSLKSPGRWNRNSSGQLRCSFDEAEDALRFDVVFSPKVDKWMYPVFTLSHLETLNGAEAIEFEVKIIPVGPYLGARFANVMLMGFTEFPLPKPNEWLKVRVDLSGKKLSDAKDFGLGWNPNNLECAILFRGIRFVGSPIARDIVPALGTNAPGTVVFTGQGIVVFCTTHLAGLEYTLWDWRDRALQSGAWPDGGDLVLKDLPIGYYRISTRHPGEAQLRDFTFAVIPNPEGRKRPTNSFFGIDSAHSWLAKASDFSCPWYNGDGFKLVADLLGWSGIVHVRDRLGWTEVNPLPKELEYGRYLRNAQLLRSHGLLTTGMFHDAPGWTDKLKSLPGNLVALYEFCKDIASTFKSETDAWEFWNEQDIAFAPEPSWDYMAAMKAAYLGFKAGNPGVIAAPGAVCSGVNTQYHENMYQNDAAKYADIVNYHIYNSPAAYAGPLKELREFQKRHGIPGRALWITEAGCTLEGNAKGEGINPIFKAHTKEQEMLQAEFYVKSQIAMQMEGVARNYYFVFSPYNEGEGHKDWGCVRRDGSVKPIYSSISTMTSQVVDGRLLGRVALGQGISAYLYSLPDGTETLVYWQESYVDSKPDPKQPVVKLTLSLPDGKYAETDMMGGVSEVVSRDGKAIVEATRYPSYLRGVKGISVSEAARPAGRVEVYRPREDEDLTVILRIDMDPDDLVVTGMKSSTDLQKSSGRVRIHAWNLDSRSKVGHLEVRGGELVGMPASLTLKPWDVTSFEAVFMPKPEPGEYDVPFQLTGVFEGKTTSKLAFTIKCLGIFLKNCVQEDLDLARPEAWKRNDSAATCNVAFDQEENALRFDVDWGDMRVDKWFYPEHVLDLPKEDLADAIALQFDVKTAQNKVENDFVHTYLMLCFNTEHEKGKSQLLTYLPPLSQWETRRIMLRDSASAVDLARVYQIRLGCNPKGTKLTYWVRNFKLLKARRK